MKKKLLTCIIKLSIFFVSLSFIPLFANAADSDLEVDWFEIMPKLKPEDVTTVNEKIKEIWSVGWEVRERYNETAESEDFKTSHQIASWIMNRDTLMNYLVFIVQFLSQLWILVWAIFIMYAGYKYMLSVVNKWKVSSSTLRNAIIWIIIVIFSYAIMKILTSIIWLS